MREGERTLGALRDASTNLTETLNAVGRVYSQVSSNGGASSNPAPLAEPFDLKQYTAALEKVATVMQGANQLVQSTEGMLVSKAWTDRVEDINRTTRQRVDHITRHVVLVMVLFFVLLVVYTFIAIKLKARAAAEREHGL
jgi:hypothetical protein